MSAPRPCLALVLLLACLASCGPTPPSSPSSTGAMRLAVSVPTAVPGDVSRVTVTVSAADMASLSLNLTLVDGAWGGVLGELPAGEGRLFQAEAFTAASVVRYQGRVEGVTVTAGATGLVTLTLQELAVPPFTNAAPLLDGLATSATTVLPGGTVSLTATAHDPNAGDPLSYAWTAPAGSFSAPAQASTVWTAPTTPGAVTLSLRVSDSRGAALTATLLLTVSKGSGANEVTVGFNAPPRVLSLTSSRSNLDLGQTTALSLTASDADGDGLSYQWSATCAGTFTGATATSATFTPSTRPGAACNNCQLNVLVKDGRGGQHTGSLALCVARNPRIAPPTVTRSYQSSLTARSRQSVLLEVGARDAQGLALTFDWTTTVGTLYTTEWSPTSSRVTWWPPLCPESGTSASITATVTNAAGAQTPRTFTVTGLLPCTPDSWMTAGLMSTPRDWHQATRLLDGRVLVSGGVDPTGSTEIYNPATDLWSRTYKNMSTSRYGHASLLLSGGSVLALGGGRGAAVRSAEMYNPAQKTWTPVGSMITTRAWSTATLLDNGLVFVAGGQSGGEDPSTVVVASTEVFSTFSLNWTSTRAMSVPRSAHTATLLPSGKVLITGGVGDGARRTAEVYDPGPDTWSPTGDMSIERAAHQATLLATGKVLITGGASQGISALATAELYDPATGLFAPTGAMTQARRDHLATRLSDGRVLLTGGVGSGGAVLATVELYDPATGAFTSLASMSEPRTAHTATLLSTGQVLVAGGRNSDHGSLRTSEIYIPASP